MSHTQHHLSTLTDLSSTARSVAPRKIRLLTILLVADPFIQTHLDRPKHTWIGPNTPRSAQTHLDRPKHTLSSSMQSHVGRSICPNGSQPVCPNTSCKISRYKHTHNCCRITLHTTPQGKMTTPVYIHIHIHIHIQGTTRQECHYWLYNI